MISNNLSLVEALRPKSNELADQIAEFVAAGGKIDVVEPPPPPKPVVYVPQEPPAPKPFVRRRVEPIAPPSLPTKLDEQIEARKQRLAKVMELAPNHTQGEIVTMTGIGRRSLLTMSREHNFKFKTSLRGRHGNAEHVKALAERDAKLAERIKSFLEAGVPRRKVCGRLGINTKTLARILANHKIDYPLSAPGGKRCAA